MSEERDNSVSLEELEKALAPKHGRKQSVQEKKWIGFTANGREREVLDAALARLGISNRADYVRHLVIHDLKQQAIFEKLLSERGER